MKKILLVLVLGFISIGLFANDFVLENSNYIQSFSWGEVLRNVSVEDDIVIMKNGDVIAEYDIVNNFTLSTLDENGNIEFIIFSKMVSGIIKVIYIDRFGNELLDSVMYITER